MKDMQLYLENLYGSHTDILYLKEEIDNNKDILINLTEKINKFISQTYSYESKNQRIKNINPDREAHSLFVYILRNNETTPIQEGCTYLARRMEGDFISNIKNAADIFAVCQGNIYQILKAHDVNNPHESAAIKPIAEVDDDIKEIIINRQYMLPMVTEPLNWTNNQDGGWLTKRVSCIHGHNPDKHRQSLDVLNILQSHRFILDPFVLTQEEKPNKPLDTADKHKQWRLALNQSQDAYKVIGSMPFHFVWRFDKRGRMYSQGYQINLQSTKFKKALISLNEPVLITGDL
jgi:hypothetical protein